MKKIAILLLLITYSFAIKDILYKPNFNKKSRILYLVYANSSRYPQELNSTIDSDDKNVFLYKGHFRVIYGIDYNNSLITKNIANNILDIANSVWKKEIEEFGFKQPKNSDRYYIDIYIGNKDAYNKESDSYVTISDSYAGYATAYSDGTPYFVINPAIDLNILKVTIAHEFFHTVQYAYGLDSVSDDIWDKNIWFLEATAVMMEDEVYDNVNDYVNYLKYYLNVTNYPLDYYNGGIEYGKVLFAKYLREKYEIDFIKSIFANYETNETILQDIKERFKDKNLSFENVMLSFAQCVANEKSCFEEGDSYPSAKRYSLDENISVYKDGFALFNEGTSRYLASSNPQYLQSDFNGTQNIVDDVNSNGLIFLNPRENRIYTDITRYNQFNGIDLKRGWNLASNIFDSSLNLNSIFNGSEIVWVYRDGRYFAYSPDSKIEKIIDDLNLTLPKSEVKPGEGFWVYTDIDENIDFDKEKLLGFDLNLTDGWNLISISSSAFDTKDINESVIIWHYDKKSQNWQFYTNRDDLNLSYKKLDKIVPANGYFVFKGDL